MTSSCFLLLDQYMTVIKDRNSVNAFKKCWMGLSNEDDDDKKLKMMMNISGGGWTWTKKEMRCKG
ncbi:hypothetical protein MTR_1g107320 [Medicago truncatula]|uniref:Uncharacterized protein n=1 Tax=Medicago truncatula TaxID=3880 RepID=A0A072VPX9_MEDTR|nr:hypothetical protein MTR_1g107320 [Medicago truncatula]